MRRSTAVDPYPLIDPLGLARPDPAERGWAHAIHRGPRTVAEVLAAASAAMDAEDEAAGRARDPIAWARARRPRSRLIDRLLHGRQR